MLRATANDGPKSFIADPYTQNGSGNQLVEVGSSLGSSAHCWACTTRAKSSSLTAVKPPSNTTAPTAALLPATTVMSRQCCIGSRERIDHPTGMLEGRDRLAPLSHTLGKVVQLS